MKRRFVAAVVWALVLGGAVTFAGPGEKPWSVFANFGLMLNGFVIPNDLTLGVQVDLLPAKFLMFSPEFSVWSNRWQFNQVTIAAGAVLNLKFGGFFLGGGFVAMSGGGYGGTHYYYEDGQWHERAAFRLKFNLGHRARHFKIMISGTPIDDGIAAVLSLGVGF